MHQPVSFTGGSWSGSACNHGNHQEVACLAEQYCKRKLHYVDGGDYHLKDAQKSEKVKQDSCCEGSG